MQVSVETLNDLERRVTVRLPSETVAAQLQRRLKAVSRKAKVDGFRPGKAPLKLVKQLYGQDIQLDTAKELIQESLYEALERESLRPLGSPDINFDELNEGQEFEYSATFEIAPAINLSGFETIKVTRPVVEITDQDVDQMIENMRWQHVTWQVVERPAAQNDRVLLDFKGTVDGQALPGGDAENAHITLNGKLMLPDFEAQLIGLTAGTTTEFTINLPDTYPNKELMNKPATFSVTIHQVEEGTLPEIDEAFARQMDIHEGGVPALRQSLLDNMQRNLRTRIRGIVKNQVTEGLFKANPISIPHVLVNAELRNMLSEMNLPRNSSNEIQQVAVQMLGARAVRRVALGLLMSDLVRRENIEADPQRVREILENHASDYQNPEEVIGAYQRDEKIMAQIESLAIEEQAIDWLVERAQLTEQTSTFTEVMSSRSPMTFGSSEELAAGDDSEGTAPDQESAPHE